MTKKHLTIAVIILFLLFITAYLVHIWPQWCYDYQRLKVKNTETNIVYLGKALLDEKPANIDVATLEGLLKKNGHSKSVLKDAWGSQLLVEINLRDDVNSYRVISFGRDKKRGSCCQKWVDDFDSDLVWEDGKWLQSYSGRWETYKEKQ